MDIFGLFLLNFKMRKRCRQSSRHRLTFV